MTIETSPEPEQQPAAPLAAVGYDDIKRSAVLYSNFRSGTNLFKSTISDLAKMSVAWEPFGREPAATRSEILFDAFLADPDIDSRTLLEAPEAAIKNYFAYFFARTRPDSPILIDLKYPQAYRLGADTLLNVPTILKVLAGWEMPVIHLVRHDAVGQAISHLVAARTGLFLEKEGSQRASTRSQAAVEKFWLDPSEVLRVARARAAALADARSNLSILSARTITVFYEDLIGPNWAHQYRRCFRFLDRYAEIPKDYRPRTTRQNSAGRVANIEEVMEHIMSVAPDMAYSYVQS